MLLLEALFCRLYHRIHPLLRLDARGGARRPDHAPAAPTVDIDNGASAFAILSLRGAKMSRNPCWAETVIEDGLNYNAFILYAVVD